MGRICSAAYPATHSIDTIGADSGINEARLWRSLYFSICVEVKNKWSYTSTPR